MLWGLAFNLELQLGICKYGFVGEGWPRWAAKVPMEMLRLLDGLQHGMAVGAEEGENRSSGHAAVQHCQRA